MALAWNLRCCTPDVTVFSDVSGLWGCGAYTDSNWFQLRRSLNHQFLSMTAKELISVVAAAAVFGRQWAGKLVHFTVGNLATVQVISATYSKEFYLMHLVRFLVFFAAHFHFWFSAIHIAGRANSLADALSRNIATLFLSQAPLVQPSPTPVPPQLVGLLSRNITWTCTSWIQQFKDILRLHLLIRHIRLPRRNILLSVKALI